MKKLPVILSVLALILCGCSTHTSKMSYPDRKITTHVVEKVDDSLINILENTVGVNRVDRISDYMLHIYVEKGYKYSMVAENVSSAIKAHKDGIMVVGNASRFHIVSPR